MPAYQWTKKSDVLSLFPTLVWKFELLAAARERLNARILQALYAKRPGSALQVPARGWQSEQSLHEQEPFEELLACIHDNATSILTFLRIGYEGFEITSCWANINPQGIAHKIHSHPNNFLSGVYYVQVPAGADTINFHDPRIQAAIIRPPVTALTAANTDQVVVRVNSGTLLFFPAYLQHSVDSNASQGERISLSFNIMFSSFAKTIAKPLW